MGAMNVLSQLRKICNHPRLIEDSQVQSGYGLINGIYQDCSEFKLKRTINSFDYEFRIFVEIFN